MSDIAEPALGQPARDTIKELKLRLAGPADLDAILGIERGSFVSPWPKAALAQEIGKRSWSRVIVALYEETLVGFMIYWIVEDELHILNLAVDPRWRKRGVGSTLLDYLIKKGNQGNRSEVLLEVRTSNEVAKRLYSRFGFEPLYVRRGYYSDSGEDALVMSLDLRQVRLRDNDKK